MRQNLPPFQHHCQYELSCWQMFEQVVVLLSLLIQVEAGLSMTREFGAIAEDVSVSLRKFLTRTLSGQKIYNALMRLLWRAKSRNQTLQVLLLRKIRLCILYWGGALHPNTNEDTKSFSSESDTSTIGNKNTLLRKKTEL